MAELVIPNPLAFYFFCTLLSVGWGACFGSFLNVCIYRIPREIPTGKPARSFCPECSNMIPWYCNIPLLSYLFLKGKCKFCGTRIPVRYFLVEALTTLLFLMIWFKFSMFPGPNIFHLTPVTHWPIIPVYWLIVFGLVLATFVDFEFMIIPDRVSIGGIIAGLAFSTLIPELHGQTSHLRGLMLSAIGASVGFFSLWGVLLLGTLIFKKEAMGFGDVKLLGAIGAFLGWQSVFFNILVSSFTGAIVGIILVTCSKRGMGSKIPYGPYIALAAVLWMLWGPTLWNAYLDMLTPDPVPSVIYGP